MCTKNYDILAEYWCHHMLHIRTDYSSIKELLVNTPDLEFKTPHRLDPMFGERNL